MLEKVLWIGLAMAVAYTWYDVQLVKKQSLMSDQIIAHDLDAVKLVLDQMQK